MIDSTTTRRKDRVQGSVNPALIFIPIAIDLALLLLDLLFIILKPFLNQLGTDNQRGSILKLFLKAFK